MTRANWFWLALAIGCGGSAPGDGVDAGNAPSADAAGPAAVDAGTGTGPDGGSLPDAGAASDAAVTPLTAAQCPGDAPGHPAGTYLYIGGGGTEGRTAASPDGASWTDETTTSRGTIEPGHTRNLIRGAGYGGGVFVVVGGHDNSYVSTTCDGVNWRRDVLGTNVDGPVPSEYASFLSDVAYRDGVFVAAGGAGKRLTSTDHGVTWIDTGEWVDGHFRGIAAGPDGFVAVGEAWGDDVGIAVTSADGTSWSALSTSPGRLGAAVYGNGRYVAIGSTRCATSITGDAWTDCGHGRAAEHASITFVGGRFYLQFLDGQTMTSSDGTSWSGPTAGWMPDLIVEGPDRYVMARWGQRGYSFDLVDWTASEFPTDHGLRGLAAGVVRYDP